MGPLDWYLLYGYNVNLVCLQKISLTNEKQYDISGTQVLHSKWSIAIYWQWWCLPFEEVLIIQCKPCPVEITYMGYLIILLDWFAKRLKILSDINVDNSVVVTIMHNVDLWKYTFLYSQNLALKYWFNLLLNSKRWVFRPFLLFLLPNKVQHVDSI